jgi:pyridoxal phosphate enzyme (YggS family)
VNSPEVQSRASTDVLRHAEIARGLHDVEQRIQAACDAAGRTRQSVTLVSVSKFKPASDLRIAYELGVRDFGENYVQELLDKQAALADLPGIRWHLIGHLQRNKARALAAHPPVLHTLDSLRLGEELDRRLASAGTRTRVLLQVNVADEEQKAGCSKAELAQLMRELGACAQLEVAGLMLIPPAEDDPEASRRWFRALAELARLHFPGAAELSMGMSHDFGVAIAEGATLVRIGTAIFGARG